MQQGDQPAFEVSPQGVIWYLNKAASEAIGVEPQQAVNTRLANYVVDGLMTQRRLEALSHSESETWQDAWKQKVQALPCELTAFAIPQSIASERTRIIVWAKSQDTTAPNPLPSLTDFQMESFSKRLLRPDQPVTSGDLERLRERFNISTNRFCEILGISMVTWYGWRKTPELPINNRTVVLHLRLLDAMPELTQLVAQPIDLQEALRTHLGISMTFSDLALWMGIERRSGYSWARGYPAGDQIRGLTASLLYIVSNKPREAWLHYQTLLEQQAALEGINVMRDKSWWSTRTDTDLSEAAAQSMKTNPLSKPPTKQRIRAIGNPNRSGKHRSSAKDDKDPC